MGLGETAEKFTPEEDPSTSTEGGLSRVGISSRATMRQGVDQPCWIRGSGGCGPALSSPSPPAHGATSLGGVGGNWKMEEDAGGGLVRALPTSPAPPLGSFSRGAPWACSGRRRAAAAAAAAAAPAVGGIGRAGR